MNSERTVDIIIPVYKPGEKFKSLLRMLCVQTVKPQRVIIVETVDDDRFDENGKKTGVFHEAESVGLPVLHKVIKKSDFDHGAVRKMAAELSDAEFFVCMTDDAVPKDEFLLERLLEGFSEESVGMVYARQLAGDDAGAQEKLTRQYNYPDRSRLKTEKDIKELGIKAFFASNVCCAYRKSAYRAVGGFSDSAIFNEDMIIARKMLNKGYAILYKAEAAVYHSHRYSGIQQFHRNFDLGMSQAMNPDIFGNIRSESEGVRYVLNTMAGLAKQGNILQIPLYIYRTGMKYAGYKLGKMYRKLPENVVKKAALNKVFVERMYK